MEAAGCVHQLDVEEVFSETDAFGLADFEKHEAAGEGLVWLEDGLAEVGGVAAYADVG